MPGGGGGAVGGPSVKASDDDPPHVKRAIERLDAMAKLIEERRFAEYARESYDFNGNFFDNGFSDSKKRDSMIARLGALDAAAFKAFGGRLGVVGDGKRVLKLDKATAEAVHEVIESCDDAARTTTTGGGGAIKEVAKRVKAYEANIARVTKMDATAFRYYGDGPRGHMDVPTALLKCEVALAATESQYGDEYVEEPGPTGEVELGCGVVQFSGKAASLGGGKFSPYERDENGDSFVERVDCKRFPKKSSYPPALRDTAQAFASNHGFKLSDLIIVLDGKPTTQTSESDLHVYRYQNLNGYSKQWKFAKNPCGDDKLLFCEAGGSQGGKAYNQLEHFLDRAQVHAGKDVDRCNQHLQNAKERATWFAKFRDEAMTSGKWKSGATYKTKKGAKLPEKQFVAAFEAKGKLADDRLIEKYCTKPVK